MTDELRDALMAMQAAVLAITNTLPDAQRERCLDQMALLGGAFTQQGEHGAAYLLRKTAVTAQAVVARYTPTR